MKNSQVNIANATDEQKAEIFKDMNIWKHELATHRDGKLCYFAKFYTSDEWYVRSFDPKKETLTIDEFLKKKAE